MLWAFNVNDRSFLRLLLLLIVDLTVVVMAFSALRSCWGDARFGMFYYYTQDSNLLAMLVCAISAVSVIRQLIRGVYALPRWLAFLRMAVAGCVTITLLIAAFVLVPMESGSSFPALISEFKSFMLSGSMLYLHTVCPLLMIASFLLLDEAVSLILRHPLLAVIPTVIYGVILLWLNIAGRYVGLYPFLRVYDQPISITVVRCLFIIGGAFLIMQGLRLLNPLTTGNIWGRL